ncbi:Shu1p [Lachancea thermotolerans CBS 6340]|uniref:KLTH0D06072p n=1 Tax=Lachancea thermotolerans (strain ATCC 56472 / CBS 6340 / NRRL Y-8284) TaxID=559295 RepID=C5DGK5_LACTC|nr:KLTH0D06072p [Lachancea thermotolerans CBS 6340]CAR22547.1 KLTH0D06072p [Lachancea thermotolerans CBS 6340]
MDTALAQLILDDNEKLGTLIFALGETARHYFEHQLSSSAGTMSSVRASTNSRCNIKVLFLNKLQYLFMYLTKLEGEGNGQELGLTNLIIYGLDEALELVDDKLSIAQTRLANLIFNVAFKVRARHRVEVQFISSKDDVHDNLNRLEQYWQEVC